MAKITDITAQSIKDSRGVATLLVTVSAGNHQAFFSVPSGASTGALEAHEMRDPLTKGVDSAVHTVNTIIASRLIGQDPTDQQCVDNILCKLDGTKQKDYLGANSILGVSGAVVRLGALVSGLPLFEYLRKTFPEATLGSDSYPYCYFNLINGGKHAQTELAFQEYHIVPNCGNPEANLFCAEAVYKRLSVNIENKYPGTVLGDEGGYALNTRDVFLPLEILKEAVNESGYEGKVSYALDVAASSFFEEGLYSYGGAKHSKEDLSDVYKKICSDQRIISIEDPFDQESFSDFANIKKDLPEVKIIGDDLTVTNKERLIQAAEASSVDGLIIKPNQIGTISETVLAISEAHKRGLVCIVSHRSGETMDDTIADIAVAFRCFGLKAGAPNPKERMVKYQRLVEITKQK